MHAPHLTSDRRVLALDAHTVNQIAAGEVVERPASALKELVENAIDAGATRISVDLEDSGRTLIRVADNGCGMSPEDARAALQRHATSKIRALDDLAAVASLGFRGEALPSIASVSRMTISTGESDGARVVLSVEGGVLAPESRESGSRGTTITVEDLFYNTPARLKFLKSATTELGQCLDALAKYAIAHADIAFVATHNGQPALQTSGSGKLEEAIGDVWSRELERGLSEVCAETAGIVVRGFASPPHLTKPTRAMQLVFVNGRPVRSRMLTAAIDQAYRSLTPERRYPVVVLLIEIAPERIDVNVSPTKAEIKFAQEGAAFDAVRYALKQALLDAGMIPSAAALAVANDALVATQAQPSLTWPSLRESGLWSSESAASPPAQSDWHAESASPAPMAIERPLAPEAPTNAGWPASDAARYPFADLLDGLKILGQIMRTFIVAENRRGLVLIDQHVAHERVLYEYLCGLKGPTALEVQPLLTPETLHFDKRSAIVLRDQLSVVRDVGFDLEPFGGESFVLRAAPAALRGKSPVKVLQDFVDELVDSTVTRKLTPTREAVWIMSSCKMAIKAGDPLSPPEMEKLIEDLAQTENPYLCPHGRPITVSISADDLLRKFGRK